MCGRFTLRAPASRIVEVFQLDAAPDWSPRYNIAPTQQVFAVRADGTTRHGVLLRWGLVPSWADQLDKSGRMINARAETVAVKPAFRRLIARRRCLVVADGYYEWQKRDGGKQPYWIHRSDDGLFAFAGLWDRWEKGDEPVESCTIITTDANRLTRSIHDRMPVILEPEHYQRWLDPANHDVSSLQQLLVPNEQQPLRADPVSTYVNQVRNEGPRCIEAVAL
ncbi:MAG: DUF159 family protein [Pirellulaceae bacterium]|nr:MAG: DUF159 family protein [Pirellulaceae bacterium]